MWRFKMADRRFRQDVGDYMSDDEYAAHNAAKANYAQKNATPGMKAYAEALKGNSSDSDPMDKMNQDIANNPLIAPPPSEFSKGVQQTGMFSGGRVKGYADGGSVQPQMPLMQQQLAPGQQPPQVPTAQQIPAIPLQQQQQLPPMSPQNPMNPLNPMNPQQPTAQNLYKGGAVKGVTGGGNVMHGATVVADHDRPALGYKHAPKFSEEGTKNPKQDALKKMRGY